MKKKDIIEIRHLFQNILTDFKSDTGNSVINRAERINIGVEKGISICNSYINKQNFNVNNLKRNASEADEV